MQCMYKHHMAILCLQVVRPLSLSKDFWLLQLAALLCCCVLTSRSVPPARAPVASLCFLVLYG